MIGYIKMYIVKIEKGVWLADWFGDPGRTLVLNNAKIFSTRKKNREEVL